MHAATALKNILNNAPRKMLSLLIGYHVWLVISTWLPTYRWIEVPLCFYETPADLQINAPESVRVAVAGNRSDLYHLDTHALAVHIDTHTLTPGRHALKLSHEQLLLPSTIHVSRWSPSNLVITLHKKELEG